MKYRDNMLTDNAFEIQNAMRTICRGNSVKIRKKPFQYFISMMTSGQLKAYKFSNALTYLGDTQ